MAVDRIDERVDAPTGPSRRSFLKWARLRRHYRASPASIFQVPGIGAANQAVAPKDIPRRGLEHKC